jgi:hypothetical protein
MQAHVCANDFGTASAVDPGNSLPLCILCISAFFRTLPLVPAEGDGSCINVNLKSSARFRAEKYRPELWDQEDASNFGELRDCL